MGYICAQNNSDSLALIFYERASKDFQESSNEWYYAQTLLERSEFNINLHNYDTADSLLRIAEDYQLDSAYQARYHETRGLSFYEKQEYDSALICFGKSLDYWQDEEAKCFSYLKIMQSYYFGAKDINNAISFAKLIVEHSTNPNYLSNAYYCLMQDAKEQDNTQLLSKYSHARTDALKLLRDNTNKYAEATPKLMDYVQNPFPLRWIRIVLVSILVLCVILILSIFTYRKHTIAKIQVSEKRIANLSVQVQEHQYKLQEQSKLQYYKKHLDKIRRKYPKPLNRWNEYAELKKDIQPYLHDWFISLEKLDLTNREKVFCVISFIYPQMATDDLANYLCITKEALHVRKNRIAKKLGITSVELGIFLQKLANRE
jgi:tetratricopeptide (TPR) repeat protein